MLIKLPLQKVVKSWTLTELGLNNWTYVVDAGATHSQNSVNFWLKNSSGALVIYSLPLPSSSSAPVTRKFEKLSIKDGLTLPAECSLLPTSILTKSFSTKKERKAAGKSSLDKPLTFGHRIVSSGYGKEEPSNLLRNYVGSNSPPTLPCFSTECDSTSTPVFHLSYSTDSARLAAALGNSTCLVVRTDRQPATPSLTTHCVLAGHGGPVLSTAWSASNRLLVTGSADRTARLWLITDSAHRRSETNRHQRMRRQPGQQIALLDFKSLSSSHQEQTTFPDAVRFVKFHHVDEFIYVAYRNCIQFYAYDCSFSINLLDKGRPQCRCKCVGTFTMSNFNAITAMASTNLFYSQLLFCAGSDRSLSIFDANVGTVVRSIEEAHAKTITDIALNEGSLYCAAGNSPDHNLFVTLSPGDCVRLWDLRQPEEPIGQLARPLTGARSITSSAPTDGSIPPVTCSFSPCGRHLAVGGRLWSLDQSTPLVYDMRAWGRCPQPMTNSPQVSNSPQPVVAWSPFQAEITAGSYNGQLVTYRTSEQ